MKKMELIVDRKWKKPTYTISNLTINGKWFCNVIEDTDRNLDSSMSPDYIRKVKDVNKNGKNDDAITAIPRGTYKVTLNIVSPTFSKKSFYKEVCNGKVPRLLNVPGFDGILIHSGTSEKSSAGCLIVGMNKVKGQVIDSQNTFKKLYKILKEASDKGESIIIKIL